MTKQLWALASVWLCTLVLPAVARADLLAKIRAEGKIRVAMGTTTPPFSSIDARNELVGSDVETARLLARDLGVKLEIVPILNADRVSVLQERRADLVISVLSITPERERQIAFSVPYAQLPVVIAGPQAHQFNALAELAGKTVGALANSSNHSDLVHDVPTARLVVYPENNKLIAGYAAGEFEVLSAAQPVVDAYNRGKPKRPLHIQFTQKVYDVAIGMPSGEKPLRDWANAWVVTNLRNDKLGQIYQRHHGRSLPRSIVPASEEKK